MSKANPVDNVCNAFNAVLTAVEAKLECMLDADELYSVWNEAQTHRDIEKIRTETIKYIQDKRAEINNAMERQNFTEGNNAST